MPKPNEEIRTVAKDSSERIKTEELRRKWMGENPGKTHADFDQFASQPHFKPWESSALEAMSIVETHARDVLMELPAIKRVDEKLKTEASFDNASADTTYKQLLTQFERAQFFSDKATWPIPEDASKEWGGLVDAAKAQVQQHAGDLASVVATVRSLVVDDLKRTNPGDPNIETTWKESTLDKSLTKLESQLKAWDAFLDSYLSLSDPKTLRALARQCAERFAEFAKEHADLYKTFKGADKEPLYIKYQLVATTKALSEKVAAQFAARNSNTPSFSVMYAQISEVPRTAPIAQAKEAFKRLAAYSKGDSPNLGTAWKEELGKLGKQLKEVNKGVFKTMDSALTALSQPSVTVADPPTVVKKLPTDKLLRSWGEDFVKLGQLNKDTLYRLQLSTNSVALDLRKYKAAVDVVLAAQEFTDIRQAYHALFDAVAMKIQSGLQLCQEL